MVNLFLRSTLVLVLLFALLFAIGMAALVAVDAPLWIAVIFAVGIILLQYGLGPWILQLIYKIDWRDPKSVDPELAEFIQRTCAARNIPEPRFGLIHDGNPNAFTFGHYPGNARLVITTGLRDMLDSGERQAVVAHELGHIAHWDFVVMTMAAVVPLVLYVLYRTLLTGRRRRDRGRAGEYLVIVGIVSFIAYIISHYIVLLLSRTREYYADRFAGEATGDPDALSGALVKVAYGLAAAPKEKKKKGETRENIRMVAAQSFGIFDPTVAQSLALASAGSGAISTDSMESAMKWDLWNPWAFLYELRSTHPLPAKRMKALERQTEAYGRVPRFSFRAIQLESYWDEFLVDLVVNYLPFFGFLAGVGAALALWLSAERWVAGAGIVLLLVGATWWLKRRFSYRHRFEEKRTIRSLIGEVKVSAVRSIPCTIEGKIIGRGIPGLFYSEDLVLRDEGGFIVLDYRQPIRLFEFFFGWIKAESLIGKEGKAVGWYRRSPRPYFELRKLMLKGGETVTTYVYPLAQFFVYASMVVGVLLVVLGFL